MAEELSPEQVFLAIRQHCLSKLGTVEDYPWDHVAWKIKGKMFACGTERSARVTLKASLEEQAVLVVHPNIEVAGYVGRFGWVTITPHDQETLQLALDLIDKSYQTISAKKK